MSANLENSAGAIGLEKVSFHSIPKKGNAKERSHYPKLHSFHVLPRSCSKILQAGLQQYWELSDVQAGFRKGRGSRDQIANIVGS